MSDLADHDLNYLEGIRKENPPKPHPLKFYTLPSLEPVSLHNHYRGSTLFLVCGGPSLRSMDLGRLTQAGVVTMAINNAWSMVRPNLWIGCDAPGRFLDRRWKDPTITKFAPLCRKHEKLRLKRPDGTFIDSAFRARQMPNVFFFPRCERFEPARWFELDAICWGHGDRDLDLTGHKKHRSTMLGALHVATHIGFRRIVLLGADFKMSSSSGYAWSQDRTPGVAKYNNSLYECLEKRFEVLRPMLEARGVQVINATPGSNLEAFERGSYHDEIDRARAGSCGPYDAAGYYDTPTEKAKP